MKIGIMGTGGIGGYFGGLLAHAGIDTHFVARGKHLQAIQEDGLQVVSNQDSFRVMIHATSEPDEIGPVDLLLFCVKSFDTLDALRFIAPMVEDDTTILSLQNGIDNVQKISQRYGEERVMGGTCFVEASIASPGVIAHVGKPGRVVFGEKNKQSTPRAKRIRDVFHSARIEVELSDDIERALWSKFLFICAVHGVGTLSRAPLGLALLCSETKELMTGVMREVEMLAQAKDVALAEDVLEQSLSLAESYNKKFKCSMLHDLEWRRQMEIEALNGMVVKLGREVGLATPLNQAIYACLKLENLKILEPFWAFRLEK